MGAAIGISLLMLLMLSLPIASAGDTDGDGVDDSVDDCPVAAGNSTVDRTGCPDKDGDGTSDKNDPWTCLLYTSPSPRDQRGSRMPSSA